MLHWFPRTTTPGETKLLASEVYELLQASSGPECDRAGGAPSGRRKAQFFLGSTNKRAKTVVLHIDGLDDSVSGQLGLIDASNHSNVACPQSIRVGGGGGGGVAERVHKASGSVCLHRSLSPSPRGLTESQDSV